MRALSDLAATAARPRALLLAIRAPKEDSELELRDWVRGVRDIGSKYGAHLCGGDLACSPGPASLCVTALGEYRGHGKPPGRDRAQAGDCVLLTGPVGGSLAGRHLCFDARVDAGLLLHHKFHAAALMDVSDGLAWDLFRLARASRLRARLRDVPIHPDSLVASAGDDRTPLWHALHDGEDHELIAVLRPDEAESALRSRAKALEGLTLIGELETGSGLLLDKELTGKRSALWRADQGGWRHGG